MKRQIITIDEDKCIGCSLCVNTCHQGAIGLVDGKARLLRDDYCDGLGRCLPVCPTGAISFTEKEVEERPGSIAQPQADQASTQNPSGNAALACGCPGTKAKALERPKVAEKSVTCAPGELPSELRQWPVQIKLVPSNAAYFDNAELLIAADCTAYAHRDFHRFMQNKITLIGCPKLDEGDYADKLTDILTHNHIRSVTVIRMEVPCCGGIVHAVQSALRNSGKVIPWHSVIIGTDGDMIER